jgi:hypothetical protein
VCLTLLNAGILRHVLENKFYKESLTDLVASGERFTLGCSRITVLGTLADERLALGATSN